MKSNSICYTGIGALPNGEHTTKQFLNMANATMKKQCATYKKSLKCKSCN